MTNQTAAVMLELVQGESGVLPAQADFRQRLGDLLPRKGNPAHRGRGSNGDGAGLAKLFAFEHYGILPDIVSLAKGLATVYLPGPFWVVVNWVLPSLMAVMALPLGEISWPWRCAFRQPGYLERGWLFETVQENSQFLLN